MRYLLLGLPAIFFARTIHAQSQTCYFPNGTALPRDTYGEYGPCLSGPSTICCAINRQNMAGGNYTALGATKDECLPNGVCQNRFTSGDDSREITGYYANFCTDKDFASGKCLNICEDERKSNPNSNTMITPCDNGATSERWCCGSRRDCCNSGQGVVRLAQILGGVSTSSIVSSAQTSPTSSPSTTSGTATATSSSTSSSSTSEFKISLSGGAIAGIVIGAIAGIALIGALIFYRRRANKYKKQQAFYQAPTADYSPPVHEAPYGDAPHYEAPTSEKYASRHAAPIELADRQPSELPS